MVRRYAHLAADHLAPYAPATSRKAVRFAGEIRYPLAGGTYRQIGFTYPVWMAQRLLDAFRTMSQRDQRTIRDWLDTVSGAGVLTLELPRVARIGLAAARIA